jgi:Tol biopolymer transport system component
MSMIGKTLGNFEITSQLGKGGMGEVYQAKDRKLGRDVAIKVLPEEFARDVDRVARFQREAKLLASLNHPNIAAIHGLEESGGTNFLVLELVQGETLADQIKRGPIPVEESLRLALQIAEALEAAHEKGVIHRDLKPANIKVTPEGKVKVLDFGLAKAFAGDREEVNLSNSPTLSNAATQQGVILGTAAYMSPEQASGKAVDKRADVWAFGVVLYEMLTGQSLFAGENVSQTLARVLERQPDFSKLPPNLHPKTIEMLERCLEKDAKNRYHDIADSRVDIQKVLADPGGVLVQPVAAVEPQRKLRTILPWVAAAIVLTAIIAGLAVWLFRPVPPRPVTRFAIDLAGPLKEFDAIALSPDGRRLVYSANGRLYLQAMDQMQATPMPGTEEGSQPFFSPDGESVAFFTGTQLKRVGLTGGIPEVLAGVGGDSASLGSGLVGAWDYQGRIFFGKGGPYGLFQVSATGGTPRMFAELGGHADFDYPEVLPGGKWVLFTDLVTGTKWSNANIVAQSVSTGERKIVLNGGHFARYAPTGHLVYAANGTLFAIGFNADSLQATGTAVPLVQNVATSEVSGHAQFAFAANGTLVYIRRTRTAVAPTQRTLVWVDRNGKEEPLSAEPKEYRFPEISPDGTKVAMTVSTGEGGDIWVWDLVRKTLTRLTFEGSNNITPLWTPDGKRIAFCSFMRDRSGNASGIFWKAADGTGQDEQLITFKDRMFIPYCLSRDGKYLVGAETPDLQKFDIGMMSMEGDHARKTLLHADYGEFQPKISPDGRWIAYASDESHKIEIYVRSFPDVNKGRWQVSPSGGDSPLWSPDGRELFYLNGDAVMAVSVKIEPSFEIVGTPKTLFRGTYIGTFPDNGTPWDISPDGKRFLMIKPPTSTGAAPAAAAPQPKINIVLNWFEELRQRVPAGKK